MSRQKSIFDELVDQRLSQVIILDIELFKKTKHCNLIF